MKGNGVNYKEIKEVFGARVGGLGGGHVCFPGEDIVLQNVPQANGSDPIKGRNSFGVWDTLFFLSFGLQV